MWLLWFGLLIVVATLLTRATTFYTIEDDTLIIRRIGSVRMEIPFRDVEDIQYQWIYLDQLSQIRMYRLGLPGKMLRIKKSSGFRYVLINPSDPDHIIKAWHLARYPDEARAQGWTSTGDALLRSSK
jgi:hypothetical protein